MSPDSSTGVEAARAFLERARSDDSLRRRIDQIVDEEILSVTQAIAAERGFEFSRADLRHAVIDQLSLAEANLDTPDALPQKCNSASGCRTPCVYCNSAAVTQSDIGEEVLNRKSQ